MSSSDYAISARGLGKAYTIAHNAAKHTTAAEAIVHRIKNPFETAQRETFWALKDVSFEIKRGDVVGIIGRNGAGKSTLLKVLSRITEPTTGEAVLKGRVGSLLEVGTGFHPELTGRENIFLNGAILGMTRREINAHFDAIVDFAGVEKFLDTPVKRYSSGMYVRLAFAVAAHLNPEILIVDEVLAVGDAEFQKKCLGKMKDVAQGGRTVLFVSHNMQAMAMLCSSAMLMRRGQIEYQGETTETITKYLATFGADREVAQDIERRGGTGVYRFTEVTPAKDLFSCNENKEFRFALERRKPGDCPFWLSAHIVDQAGVVITQCDSRVINRWPPDDDAQEGTFQISSPWLKPGTYRLDLYICAYGWGVVDAYEGACGFEISPVLPYAQAVPAEALERGLVLSSFDWQSGPLAVRASDEPPYDTVLLGG
ncbi:MAG: polysaccharide ABC transporter ATP-binding protein [Capsulimonadaceae bacterium]|nr:polysaccharide ABC transporter ATP-binding protein [Capsulimonadaceae bacterium]